MTKTQRCSCKDWSGTVWSMLAIIVWGYTWNQRGISWLLGSLTGWFVTGLTLVGGSLPWWWYLVKRRFLSIKQRPISWVFCWVGMFLFLALALLPPERLPWGWRDRQQVLLPVWWWFSAGCGLVLLRHPMRTTFAQRAWALVTKEFSGGGRIWLLVTVLMMGATGWIAATRWGVSAPWPLNWQGYPAPLLPQHLLISLLFVGIVWRLGNWRQRKWPQWSRWGTIPLFLWVVALAIWWNAAPTENYFLSLPMSPNNEPYYPASDAATYFFRTMQGKLGWGYGGWHWVGNPFLRRPGMFTLLHLVSCLSSRYSFWVFMWVAILALSVPIIYRIGKRLHSSGLGLLLALTFIGHETVAIQAARRLAVVHVKNLMSEPLLRLIFLGLVAALIMNHSNKPSLKWQQGLLVGALVGWSALVRVESLVPVLVILSGYGLWTLLQPRTRWLSFGSVLLGLFFVWAPWMWRSAILSKQVSNHNSVYYNSPWFFLPALRGASSPGYRYLVPTMPSPPTPSATQRLSLTPSSAPSLPPSSAPTRLPPSSTTPSIAATNAVNITTYSPTLTPDLGTLPTTPAATFIPPLTPPPTATPTPTFALTPSPTTTTPPTSTLTLTATPTPFLPIHYLPPSIRQPLLRVPVLGSLLRWWKITWEQWWAYIGRNVVTSWTAWPWSPRFYTPLQAVEHRPLASNRPLKTHYIVILLFNLAVWALGWTAIWQRSRWAATAPWIVYGAYIIGLAFGRTGGGRYIVPIDWIPLMYYLAGWLVLAQALWQAWGWEVPSSWWLMESRQTPPSPVFYWGKWGSGILALALVILSATGVGIERYAVVQADHHPEKTPPRRRVATLGDVSERLTAWDAWRTTSLSLNEFQERTKGQKWQAVWGFAYFPRFLPAGTRGGEWIHHERFNEGALFVVVLSSRGVTPLALSPSQTPHKIPLGVEAVALVCPKRYFDAHRTFVAASLLAVRSVDGSVWVYSASKEAWHCP